MKKRVAILILLLIPVLTVTSGAEVTFDGFVQGLYGGGLDRANPTASEYTANEARLQLRAEHYGDAAELFRHAKTITVADEQHGGGFRDGRRA